MATYFVGTQPYFEALPIPPEIGTMNGGIRLNSNIAMAVGASVVFEGLRFNEVSYTALRNITDSNDSASPRWVVFSNTTETTLNTGGASIVQDRPVPCSTTAFTPSTWITVGLGNLGAFFMRGVAGPNYARCRSRSITVKDAGGNTVWQWLTQASDWKTTPPGGTVVGTLDWYKRGIEANYTSVAAFTAAVTAPTEAVRVIYEPGTDVSAIPATINGQTVTTEAWGTGTTTVLCGSMAGYYSYRRNAPYLAFTGGGAAGQRAVLPANLALSAGDVVALDYYHVSESAFIHVLCDAADASDPRFGGYISTTAPNVLDKIVGLYTLFSKDGITFTQTITLTPDSWQRVFIKATGASNLGIFGARGGTFISPIKGGIKNISITRNGVTTYYLRQGDQNPNGIMPSTPSGSNGTIVGAGWKYQNVSAHYETATLLNNRLSSTVLNGDLIIEDLDNSIQPGTFPTTKDGFSITLNKGAYGGRIPSLTMTMTMTM